jgi:hypothetical protein
MVRATEGGEQAAGPEKFQCAKVDFLVAAHSVRDGRARAGEGGGIKDNGVEFRDDFFVRLDGGLGLEPVEDIDRFKGAFLADTVGQGIASGGGDSVRALIKAVHVGRARARAVQGETAEKAETIQRLSAGNQFGDELVIPLLIEIKPGLVPAGNVDVELESVKFDGNEPVEGTGQYAVSDSKLNATCRDFFQIRCD